MKTKTMKTLPPKNSWKQNKHKDEGGQGEREKIEITDGNGEAERHNFLITGQQMCPWPSDHCVSKVLQSFDGG